VSGTGGNTARAPWGVGAGLILVLVGTFCPWLRSGTVSRSSYAASGALRRLLGARGPLGTVLRAWPFLGLAAAVAAALLVVGLTRAGAGLAVLVAFAAAAVAGWALSVGGSGLVRPAPIGPAVTIAGAALTVAAAAPCLIRSSHSSPISRRSA
jgi:hypothetical protein